MAMLRAFLMDMTKYADAPYFSQYRRVTVPVDKSEIMGKSYIKVDSSGTELSSAFDFNV